MYLLMLLASYAAPRLIDVPKTDARVYQLQNGLRVVVERQDRTDTAALYIRYATGSAHEQPGEHGCAHLFEHLMFEGSAHVPHNAFDEWLTAAGGENNAWTSYDETVYYMTFPSGALDLALFLESDRLGWLDAGITPSSLSNQQDVVLQERELGYDAPHGRDIDALSALLFAPTHPYHSPVIGTIQDVRGFTLDAVRQFWHAHYRTRNATLVLVGPFDPDQAAQRVAHWFGSIVDSGPVPVIALSDKPAPPLSKHGVLYDRVDDRTLYIGWPTPAAHHDDAPALEVMAYLLDDGPGTLLHEGWWRRPSITEVAAGVWQGELAGSISLSASSPKLSLATLKRHLLQEIESLAQTPRTQASLERAKASIISARLREVDTPSSRANLFMQCMVMYGDPNCLDRFIERVRTVDAQTIMRVAAHYLTPKAMRTLSVIPEGDDGAITGAAPVDLP